MNPKPLAIALAIHHPAALLPLLALLLWPASALPASPATRPIVDYFIVITGDELLAGAYPDGHTHFLTRTLAPLGLRCAGSITVDDRRDDITDALRFATAKANLVIVTGGMGPTDNDITRQTLSEFTAIPLREHPDVLQDIERRFNTPRDQLRPTLRRQTLVPSSGDYLKNPDGTAVGLVFHAPHTLIVALPGPPRELQPMVRNHLVPYLSKRLGTRQHAHALLLRFVGIGQSQITQTIKDNVPLPMSLAISSQFDGSRVDFTFTLSDDTPDAPAQLQNLKQSILKHLGDYLYADDPTSLEEHVLRLLAARGATLAIAEAGTGGSLAAALLAPDNSHALIAGAFVAPTDDKLRRLLRIPDDQWNAANANPHRANLLAAAAAKLSDCPSAVAVGEIQSDNASNRYLHLVLQLPGRPPENQRLALRGNPELARSTLLTQILDHLRRRLR